MNRHREKEVGWDALRGLPAYWRLHLCKNCNTEFEPDNAAQRYCNVDCRNDYSNKELRTRGRFLIFARDNFSCAYCGQTSYQHGVELVADHIYPKSLGGNDTAENLITSCYRCNAEKSDFIIDEDTLSSIKSIVRDKNLSCNIPNNLTIKIGL